MVVGSLTNVTPVSSLPVALSKLCLVFPPELLSLPFSVRITGIPSTVFAFHLHYTSH